MPKPETIDIITPKMTCERAIERNMTRCPLLILSEKFFGTLTLKFVNGEIHQAIKEESVKI